MEAQVGQHRSSVSARISPTAVRILVWGARAAELVGAVTRRNRALPAIGPGPGDHAGVERAAGLVGQPTWPARCGRGGDGPLRSLVPPTPLPHDNRLRHNGRKRHLPLARLPRAGPRDPILPACVGLLALGHKSPEAAEHAELHRVVSPAGGRELGVHRRRGHAAGFAPEPAGTGSARGVWSGS